MSNKFGGNYQRIQAVTASATIEDGVDLVLVTPAAATTITLPTPVGKYPEEDNGYGRIRVVNLGSTGIPVTVAAAAGSIVGQTLLVQSGQSVDCESDGVGTWYANFGARQNSFEVNYALTSANILAMNGAAVTILPAMGANKVTIVEHIFLKMVTTATQYANGGAVEFRYTNASGAKVTADIAAAVITAGAGTSYTANAGITTSLTALANALICVTNATAAFITGTGTGVITIRFRVIDVA